MPKNENPADDFNMESTLEALRRLKERDPHFEQAIQDFVDAEVKYGKDDPAEGKIFIQKRKAPKRSN